MNYLIKTLFLSILSIIYIVYNKSRSFFYKCYFLIFCIFFEMKKIFDRFCDSNNFEFKRVKNEKL